jgi:hypothetical protein
MQDYFTDNNGTHYKKVGDRFRRIIDGQMFDSVEGLKQWQPKEWDGYHNLWEHELEKSNNRHIHKGY